MTGTVVFDNVIEGRAVAPVGGSRRPIENPATGAVYAHAAESDGRDVDLACAAALKAFADWRETTPADRSRALLAAADVLEAHADDLSRVEVADTGKPYAVTLEEELPPIVDQIRFFAGACRLLTGLASTEYIAGVTSAVRREPVGVCGQITPWNYPLMMAVWKWAPAIAAGNTVVLKPSELTPASTVRMAELLADVFPPGVLNVVCGGAGTGEALVRHPAVAMVSLTGSPRAGRQVAIAAAERLARVHLELGGNAPVLIFADVDVSSTAEAVADAGFFNAGQDCTAATRVLVESEAYEPLLAALSARADADENRRSLRSRNDRRPADQRATPRKGCRPFIPPASRRPGHGGRPAPPTAGIFPPAHRGGRRSPGGGAGAGGSIRAGHHGAALQV